MCALGWWQIWQAFELNLIFWQIFTKGQKPYEEWGNTKVWKEVIAGYRLQPPGLMPEAVASVMTKCFGPTKDRPSMEMVCRVYPGLILCQRHACHKGNCTVFLRTLCVDLTRLNVLSTVQLATLFESIAGERQTVDINSLENVYGSYDGTGSKSQQSLPHT